MSNVLITDDDSSNFLKVSRRNLKGQAKWKDIEDLINRWARRDKKGALEQEQWLREARETLADKKNAKWAQGFSGSNMRVDAETKFSLLMHPDLLAFIETFYPKQFNTKEDLHEFMQKFPKFKIRQVL